MDYRRNKKNKSKSKSSGKKEVSPVAVMYNGRVQYPVEKQERSLHTVVFGFSATVTSSGAGAIQNVYGSAPNGAVDWTNVAATFEEFRTLAFEISFFPNNRYSKISVTTTPLLGIIDRAANSTVASYDVMLTHESCRTLSLEDPWTMVAKMSSQPEAEFQSIASPTDVFWMKFFSTGLTNSTTYGQFFIKYRVQFRARA